MTSQENRMQTIVFVGGSSGLGFEALKSLLSGTQSYQIILGSRTPLESWRVGQLSPLLKSSRSSLDRLPCDLSRYDSVRAFASHVRSQFKEPIHALVLCAGAITNAHRVTADGEDEMLQVNVLSHALLLECLAPQLGSAAEPSRVLIVSSGLHRKVLPGTITPENLDAALTTDFDPMVVYQITKFLELFLLFIAQQRYATLNPKMSIVAMSPGFVPDTGLSRELGYFQQGVMQWVMPKAPFATTITEGGRNICRGITQDYPSGTYFSQRHVEHPAEECYVPEMQQRWQKWLVDKGVWHPETAPDTSSRPPAPDFSAKETAEEVAEWSTAAPVEGTSKDAEAKAEPVGKDVDAKKVVPANPIEPALPATATK